MCDQGPRYRLPEAAGTAHAKRPIIVDLPSKNPTPPSSRAWTSAQKMPRPPRPPRPISIPYFSLIQGGIYTAHWDTRSNCDIGS